MTNPTRTLSRRQALRQGLGGLGGALLGGATWPLLSAPALAAVAGGSKRLIVLWLEGGPSQMETFDPKPGTTNGGPTRGLKTDVPGWLFADNLPQVARRAEHLCVIRSMTSKEGNHSRAREFVKTGHVPNPTVSFPALGAIVASELGRQDCDLPAYVQVNGAPSPAGYLGIEHAPFVVNDPGGSIRNLDYHRGVDARRLDHRLSMLDVIERGFVEEGGRAPVAANVALRRRARALMDSKQRAAFDLDQEKESVRTRYGDNDFGRGCLLARRLLEAGVSAVEVVLGGWDTHNDNFRAVNQRCQTLDPAFAALMDDLRRTGLHRDTLVMCLGEFGRTPQITATDGRNHWPHNWCVALFGTGIRGGMAYGETDPEGEEIVSAPVTVPDLYATVAHVLGFDPDRERTVARRPITLVATEGRIVRDILA